MGWNRVKKFTLTVAFFGLLLFSLATTVGASSTMWSRTYGGTDEDAAYSLVETSDGGYALAGYTTSLGAGESDFWLVKTDEHRIIPEFPSLTPPLIMVVAVNVLGVTYRRKLNTPKS